MNEPKEMFVNFARLRPVEPLEVAHLQQIAAVDMHNVIMPTHAVVKNGEIVGHFSVAGAPLWTAHLATVGENKVTPHDTFRLIHTVEQLIQLRGAPGLLTLVGKESRLHPKMSDLGYRCIGSADVFLKEF